MKELNLIVIRLIIVLCLFSVATGYAQQKNITGSVVDNNNISIVGATVSVTHLGKIAGGAITDLDGKFNLSAPVGSILKFSFIGYKSYEDTVTEEKNVYNVVMIEELQSLDEVVVVGYGYQKRSELTGAISSVSSKEVKDFSSKSIAESLSGLAAGVTVTKNDGMPGSSADIIIRGAGSLNSMAPLYVVDGVPQEAGFNFNMRDVASVEILKDAGSAAIYGSRAAGGVILITTLRGKEGEKSTIVNANGRYGIREITTDIKLLNTQDWIRARDAFGTSNTLDILGVTSLNDLPNTDWMDVMFGTGTEQEYNISLTSSSEKGNFFLSAGYLGEKGVYMDTRADRYTFRNNSEHRLGKHITIGESIYGSSVKTNPATSSSIYDHTIPFRTVPVSTVYDADGNFAMTNEKAGSGPNFAGLEHAFHVFQDNNYTLNAQAFMNINFIKGLDLRITGSGEYYGFSKNTFTEYKDFGPVQVSPQRLDAFAGTKQNLMFNSVLTFDKKLNNHNFKIMAGTEYWKLDGYNLKVTAYNFSIPVSQSISLASAGPTKDASDYIPVERRGSFFGRINYNYNEKYLLTANFRADASDRFIGKNQWGYFPSVNVGWKFSDEGFMSWTKSWLDIAKIRCSWGLLGNDASVPQFMYASTWSGTGISHSFDGTSTQQSGYWLAVFGNKDLKWEEINQIDAGLDLNFFKNRLIFSYDYYNRQTRDMLYRGALPLSAGMSYYFSSDDPANTVPVYFNAGLVENKGHEISLEWKNKKKEFFYSIKTNASFNTNLVKQVGDKPGANPIDGGLDNTWSLLARTQDGNPMSMFYGYKVLGIFKNQTQLDEYNRRALDAWKVQNPAQTSFDPVTGQPLNADGQPIGIYYQRMQTGVGDLIFDDNGQGRVTPASRQFIGNPWPKMNLGLNLNMEYKGFDLSAVFQGAFGFDIMNLVKPYTQMFSSDNTTADIFNTSCFGVGNTTITDNPRVGYIDENGSFIADGAANRNYSTVSAYMIEKGDYVKLKNLSFGYTVPNLISRKASVQKLRVYTSIQNVFTITGYTGIDPEIGGNVLMRGVDNQNRYLPSRLVSFGIDLTF